MDRLSKIIGEVEENLKFIATSGVRMKMLSSLLERPKTSTELKDEFKIGASTIIHAARDLEREGYIKEEIDGYHLTTIGKIATLKLIEMAKTLYVLKKEKDFWLTHKIEDIPEEFITKFGELQGLRRIKATPTNLLQVLSLYIKIVGKSKVLQGISPVFVSEFSKLVKKLIKKGGKVELVISKDIKKPVLDSYQKEVDEEVKKRVKEGMLRIWEIDNVSIAMSVSERFLSIGFFNNDGTYDFTQDLVSYDKEAIEWGRKLFEYYKSRAKEIRLY